MGEEQPHILVVDDEELNRDLLGRRLKRSGFRVTTAASGREALGLIEQTSFSLVLLDVMMPELSGLSMLQLLRATRSAEALPVIMATAIEDSATVVEALSYGANDYVTKPLDFPVVLARIEAHLDRRASFAQTSEQAARYSQALQSSRAAVWDLDLRTSTLSLSQEWRRTTGEAEIELTVPLEDWLGYVEAEHRSAVRAAIDMNAQAPECASVDVEFRMWRPDGLPRWLRVLANVVRTDSGDAARLIGSQLDVTELRQLDAATRLPNRHAATEFLARHRKSGLTYSAALSLRVDAFAVLRDGGGAEAADSVISSLGAMVHRAGKLFAGQDNNPCQSLIVRSNEDEIALVLACEGDSGVSERLRAIAAGSVAAAGRDAQTRSLRIRPGFALESGYRMSPELLMSNARVATLAAGSRTPTEVSEYVPGMRDRMVQSARVEDLLATCVEDGRLFALYQPIIRIADGSVDGVEALLRMRDELWGTVSPAEFIPIAERSGRIEELGMWVLRRACADLKNLRVDLRPEEPLHLSVNVSALQLLNEALPGDIAAALRESGFPAHRLSLEITESTLFDGDAQSLRVLDGIRDLGVELRLDDFGTGYTSLQTLLRIPINGIKIDQSLVRAFGTGGQAEHIVESVVSIAKVLRCCTVAEGIETVEQYRAVAALGCDYAQGYLLGRPIPETEIAGFLQTWRPPAM
jgi:PAS domain S-box-containing protein